MKERCTTAWRSYSVHFRLLDVIGLYASYHIQAGFHQHTVSERVLGVPLCCEVVPL